MKEMEINKPAIIARLKAYRERKGPDAYRILAHYVGKKSVSSYVLQSTGETLPPESEFYITVQVYPKATE